MDLLVNNGANVNQADKQGKTPLHRAAEMGNFLNLPHFSENSIETDKKYRKLSIRFV